MQSQGLKLEKIEVEHLQLQHEEQSGVQSHQLNELSNNIHFQFDDELFGTSRTNEMKSRSQKRNHQQYWTEEKLGIKKESYNLKMSLCHRYVLWLEMSLRIARQGSSRAIKYYQRYYPTSNNNLAAKIDQLILPTQQHESVLKITDQVPMTGHLGKCKTADQILRRFYWPTVFKDVGKCVKHAQSAKEIL